MSLDSPVCKHGHALFNPKPCSYCTDDAETIHMLNDKIKSLSFHLKVQCWVTLFLCGILMGQALWRLECFGYC